MIETALEQIPGRAIVNSVNLEAGRDKLDTRRPARHRARRRADRADDRRGRHGQDAPSARSRSPSASSELVCDEHGLDPELLIFDAAHLHADHRRRGVAARRRSRRSRASARSRRSCRGVKTSLGVSNVSFGVCAARARGPQLGLPAPLRGGRARPRDGQPEPHHAVRRDLRGGARARRRPRLQPPRGRAASASSTTSSPRARRPRPRPPTRPPAWSPRRRCTGTSCAARRTASRTGSTARSRRSAPSRRSTTCCCRP